MKISNRIIIALMLFFPVVLMGQKVCDVGNTTFFRQSQLDSFAILYPECEETGDIRIFGSKILNLNALKNLKRIERLTIEKTKIQNLDDLIQIREITSLIFANNDNTKVLTLHDSLIIKQTLSILGCDSLIDIINYYEYDLLSLLIVGNPLLKGIKNLKINNVNYCLLSNTNFNDLSYHSIKHCVILNLDGFKNLNKIADFPFEELELTSSLLNSIDELNEAKKIKALKLFNNKNLSNCSIDIICENLDNSDFKLVVYTNNATGCNSIDEIRAGCLSNSINHFDTDFIKIYPNPFVSDIQIDTKIDVADYKLFNAYGDIVSYGAFSPHLQLSDLQSGLYVLKLYGLNKELVNTSKLIKIE